MSPRTALGASGVAAPARPGSVVLARARAVGGVAVWLAPAYFARIRFTEAAAGAVLLFLVAGALIGLYLVALSRTRGREVRI